MKGRRRRGKPKRRGKDKADFKEKNLQESEQKNVERENMERRPLKKVKARENKEGVCVSWVMYLIKSWESPRQLLTLKLL